MLFVVFNYIKVVAGNECCNNHFHLRVESDALIIFALFLSVIGPENSCYFLNQSDLKLNPITTWSPAFSRALEKWKNVLFFCKKTVCYFITRLDRDWIETYSSFDWIAQRNVNRDTRLSYFPWNAKLQFAAFLWDWIVKLLHLWNVKRQVSSTFCEVISVFFPFTRETFDKITRVAPTLHKCCRDLQPAHRLKTFQLDASLTSWIENTHSREKSWCNNKYLLMLCLDLP